MPPPPTGGGGGGGGNPNPDIPTTPQPTTSEKVQDNAKKLKAAFGDKLKKILQKTTIKVSSDLPGFAMAATTLNPQSIYDPNVQVTITIPEGLTDIQMKLLLGHEYWHLSLYEISINAGSYKQLQINNPELAYQIDLKVVNSGHHNYMVSEMDEYETFLRKAFTGESEEFYKYGKWGGGPLYEIDAYKVLSLDDYLNVKQYLESNGLRKPTVDRSMSFLHQQQKKSLKELPLFPATMPILTELPKEVMFL